jgi:serine-type D-Ala-D-Ala carboxypeptidase/endopeptidase (penicillin-binding protein 4)
MTMKTLLLAVVLCCSFGHAWAYDDDLPPAVQALMQQAGLPSDALAAIAIPTTRWARSWQHRADVPMQPASTMKIVTTIVALDRLGPNHRGFTELWASAAPQGVVLPGDLVFKGGADPEFDLPALWQMLYELRGKGVRDIAGSVRLDRSLFRPARIDIGLPPFDESPERPYNMIPDALMLSGNLMGLQLASNGERLTTARAWPPLDGVSVDASAMSLVDADCADWDAHWQLPTTSEPQPGRHVIALQGRFPKKCDASATLQLLDRNVLAERQVRAVWTSLGGVWRQPPGRAQEGAVPAGAWKVARHEARPWGEVLRTMNKTSDNALTRLLYLQLGTAQAADPPDATSLALAQRSVERWLDERGIARPGLVMDNGSGLSRSDRIAPRTMARMIEAALQGRHAPELLMSLPVAGIDGTMRRRLKGTPAEGWARLKTGTLRNVSALAGTVKDTRGDAWIVVAFVNHDDANREGKGRAVLDALIEWVARSGARWR